MENKFSLTFSLAPEDCKYFNYVPKILPLFIAAMALFGILFIVYNIFNGIIKGAFVGIISMLLGALLCFVVHLIIQRKMQKFLENAPALYTPIRYTFNNQEIIVTSAQTNIKYQWNKVYKVIEHKKMLHIYTAPDKAMVFPYRLLSDEIGKVKYACLKNVEKKKIKLRK